VLVYALMHVEIPHQFSKKEAINRVKKALNESRGQILQQAPDFKADWQDDTLAFEATVQGKQINGTLEVEDKQFILDAKLPLLWRMFEGRIEKAIRDQVATLS
jgi:hypothetical protein